MQRLAYYSDVELSRRKTVGERFRGEGANGSKFWRASNAINSEAAIIENGVYRSIPLFFHPHPAIIREDV